MILCLYFTSAITFNIHCINERHFVSNEKQENKHIYT